MAGAYHPITAITLDQINNRFKAIWDHFGTLNAVSGDGGGGTGITDGTKNEIIVSSGGSNWQVKGGTITADRFLDGSTNRFMTTAEKSKLAGIAAGATVNSSDADLRNRATHTGTQTADTIINGTLNKVFTAAEQARLAGVAPNATANDTDANLKNRANHTGTQSADTLTDGSANRLFTSALFAKLAGIAAGATVNSSDAALRDRTTHTGLQSADTIIDGTTNRAFTAAERTKLAGIAVGATANSADATLLSRANHTGTQLSTTISDLQERVEDIVANLIKAGSNVTVAYDDAAGTFTINSIAAGGGSVDAEGVRDTIAAALQAGTNIQVTVNDPGDTITISSTATVNSTDAFLLSRSNHTGQQSADTIIDGTTNKAFTTSERTKLASIAAGATVNSTDSALRDRSTHTGTQSADTIIDGTLNKVLTAADKAKLDSIPTQTENVTIAGALSDGSTGQGLTREQHVVAYVQSKMGGGGGGGNGIGQALHPINARFVPIGDELTAISHDIGGGGTTGQHQNYGYAAWALFRSGGYYIPKGGNLGIWNNSTANIVARIGTLYSFLPHVVAVLAGGNDIVFGYSAASIKANLREIYDAGLASGAKVIAITILPRFGTSALDAGGESIRNEVNNWIRAQTNVTVIDAESALYGAQYYESDGKMTNPLGAQILGELVGTAMRAWITPHQTVNALGADTSLSPNPQMIGIYGGLEPGATGTVADGWQVSGPGGAGGATITASKYLDPDSNKEAQEIELSGNYSSVAYPKVQLYYLNTTVDPNTMPKPGTLIEAIADIEIVTALPEAVDSVFAEFFFQEGSFGATIVRSVSLYQTSAGNLSMPTGRYQLRTPPMEMGTAAVGTMWVTLTMSLRNTNTSTPLSGRVRVYGIGCRAIPTGAEPLLKTTFGGLNTTSKRLVDAINEVRTLAQAGGGGGGSATNLDGLTDVVLTNPQTGEVLKRNADGFWRNMPDDVGSGSLPAASKYLFAGSANGTSYSAMKPLGATSVRTLAAGDGVTDDTANIASVIANNSYVWFDEGTYRITGRIQSLAARNDLRIEFHPNAVVIPDGSGWQISHPYFDFRNVNRLHIKGMRVQGHGSVAGVTSYSNQVDGINIDTCNDVTVEDCYFTNIYKSFVRSWNNNRVVIRNNRIFDMLIFSMEINNCVDVQVYGNHMVGRGDEQYAAGRGGSDMGIHVLFTLCQRVLCHHNYMVNSLDTSTKTEGCDYVVYDHNVVRQIGKDGIKIMSWRNSAGTVTVPVINGIITNNVIENLLNYHPNGSGLIKLADLSNFTVSGNVLKGGIKNSSKPENGIHVDGFYGANMCQRGTITGNTIVSPTYCGILLEDVNNVLINGNGIYNYAVANQPNSHGIYMPQGSSGNTNKQISVLNNDVMQDAVPTDASGNSSSAIWLRYVNGVRVIGNKCWFPKQCAVAIDAMSSDNISIINNEVQQYDYANARGSNAPAIVVRAGAASQAVRHIIMHGNYGIANHAAMEVDTVHPQDATKTMTVAMWSVQSNVFKCTGGFYNMMIRHYGASIPVTKLYTIGNAPADATTKLFDFFLTGTPTGAKPTLWQVGEYEYRSFGTPEGAVIALPGSKCLNVDGTAGSFWYQKNTGTGNTGWVAQS